MPPGIGRIRPVPKQNLSKLAAPPNPVRWGGFAFWVIKPIWDPSRQTTKAALLTPPINWWILLSRVVPLDDDFYTAREVSERLKEDKGIELSVSSVRHYRRLGLTPPLVTVGASNYYTEEHIQAIAEAHSRLRHGEPLSDQVTVAESRSPYQTPAPPHYISPTKEITLVVPGDLPEEMLRELVSSIKELSKKHGRDEDD